MSTKCSRSLQRLETFSQRHCVDTTEPGSRDSRRPGRRSTSKDLQTVFIKDHEYVADVLSQWERDKRSSMTMAKYTTVSHKPSYTAALGGGDSKFVFNKRVFRRPKEIPEDPIE